MPSVRSIVDGDNKRKLREAQASETEKKCNCPKNTEYPLEVECLAKEIICQATVRGKRKNVCRFNSNRL